MVGRRSASPMTLTPVPPQAASAAERSVPDGRWLRPGRLARWSSRLALLVLALLLPLLLLEISLRLFGPILPGNYRTGQFQTAHPVYGRFHVPNFDGWVRNPEFVAHVKINSIGLRDDEVAIPKPPGTFRIVVVGDSFV